MPWDMILVYGVKLRVFRKLCLSDIDTFSSLSPLSFSSWLELTQDAWSSCSLLVTMKTKLPPKDGRVEIQKGVGSWWHHGAAILQPAAAAAKSLQSCPILWDPMDGSPPGFSIPGFPRQEHWSGLPFPSPMHESGKRKWVAQSCLTLIDPMDCSPPGSSIHGIFQATVLEWDAMACQMPEILLHVKENGKEKKKKKLLLLCLFLALNATAAHVWPGHGPYSPSQCFRCPPWVRPMSGGCKLSMCGYTRLVPWWVILTKFWWLILSVASNRNQCKLA